MKIKSYYEFINENTNHDDISDINKILNILKIDYGDISFLDSGMYGEAYDIGNGKVVKVTTVISEAYYMNKLINIVSPNLIRVYDVVNYDDVYYIVMEKLNTNLHSAIRHVIDYLYDMNSITTLLNSGKVVSDDMVYDFFKEKILSLDRNGILYVFNLWYDIYKECKKYNLPIDDLRSRNVGISKRDAKTLVFFDISNLYSVDKYDLKSIKKITI